MVVVVVVVGGAHVVVDVVCTLSLLTTTETLKTAFASALVAMTCGSPKMLKSARRTYWKSPLAEARILRNSRR